MHHQMSRREFVAVAAAAPFVLSQTPARATLSAQVIVDRIKANVGVEWRAETVDTFKAGDPATITTGVVTTAMATMDVLTGAVKAGANLVITAEPTFYGRGESATPPARPDPVLTAKREFIAKHNLVVWRFSDHWRLRKPDPFAQGLIDALGWSKFKTAADPSRVSISQTRLDSLAAEIKKKLNARGGVRVIGNPQTRVTTIGVLPGSTPIQASLNTLPGVDVVVAGEMREWESVEYARDFVTAGEMKGLILVGRVLSEDPGMNVCAQWLKTLVPEVPTSWMPAGDPYWRPA